MIKFDKRYCIMCGKSTQCVHHLIFGMSKRQLAEEDNLKVYMCNNCHNLAYKPVDRIHGNTIAEKLSKMLGQCLYEKELVAKGRTEEESRKKFVERYGRSYI